MNAATTFARDNMWKIALVTVSAGIAGWFAYKIGFVDFLVTLVVFGAMLVPVMMLVTHVMTQDEYNKINQSVVDTRNEFEAHLQKEMEEKFNALWRAMLQKENTESKEETKN